VIVFNPDYGVKEIVFGDRNIFRTRAVIAGWQGGAHRRAGRADRDEVGGMFEDG